MSAKNIEAANHVVVNRTPAPKSTAHKRFNEHISAIPQEQILYKLDQLSTTADLERPSGLGSRVKNK